MNQQAIDCYRRRLAEERSLSWQSPCREARQAHRAMAEEYDALLANICPQEARVE